MPYIIYYIYHKVILIKIPKSYFVVIDSDSKVYMEVTW